jgi:hypothetical protein
VDARLRLVMVEEAQGLDWDSLRPGEGRGG